MLAAKARQAILSCMVCLSGFWVSHVVVVSQSCCVLAGSFETPREQKGCLTCLIGPARIS